MDPNGEETFKFESTVVGGNIPKEYIPAVGEGIEEAAQTGIIAGFPVLGVHATVYDGSYHEVDSSEMAFHIAGSMAFKDAMAKGDAVLLEAYHEGGSNNARGIHGRCYRKLKCKTWTD